MKKYNVKVKLVFETEFDHSQANIDELGKDVDKLIDGYLDPKNRLCISILFDIPPRRIYKIRELNDYEKN